MPRFHRSTAFDRAFDKALEKEPTYNPSARQRIPLCAAGTLKAHLTQRAPKLGDVVDVPEQALRNAGYEVQS